MTALCSGAALRTEAHLRSVRRLASQSAVKIDVLQSHAVLVIFVKHDGIVKESGDKSRVATKLMDLLTFEGHDQVSSHHHNVAAEDLDLRPAAMRDFVAPWLAYPAQWAPSETLERNALFAIASLNG